MSAPELRTCRFCGMSNYDYKHPAVRSFWIKYGTRHSCHLQCAIEKQGPTFLHRLTTWQVSQLPDFEVRALGIEAKVRELLTQGPALCAHCGLPQIQHGRFSRCSDRQTQFTPGHQEAPRA